MTLQECRTHTNLTPYSKECGPIQILKEKNKKAQLKGNHIFKTNS